MFIQQNLLKLGRKSKSVWHLNHGSLHNRPAQHDRCSAEVRLRTSFLSAPHPGKVPTSHQVRLPSLHFLPLAGCRGLWSRLSHAPYSQYSWHASNPCCCQGSGFAQVCSRTCVLFTHASQRVGTQGPSSFSSLAIFFIPTQRIRGKKKSHCEKKC